MNSKIATMGLFAVLMVAAFAGIVAVGEDADAEEVGYSITYKVGDKTFIVPNEDPAKATVTLKTLADIGATGVKDKTFTAWKDGEGNTYLAGSTYIISDSVNKTAILTAQFDWTTYTAIFLDAEGNTLDTIKGTANSGGEGDAGVKDLSEVAPVAPDVDGKIFVGWMTEGAEKAIATEDLGTLVADVTYKAVYVVDYKVYFQNGDMTYETCVSELTVPPEGAREGFKFVGWYVGETKVEDPEEYDFKADTTFVAKWEPAVYTVAFVVDGETVLTQSVKHGETATEPKIVPAKDGFDFVAWTVGDVAYDFSSAVTGDLTVTASFEAVPAPAPTGLKDPMTQMLLIIIGTLILALIALGLWKRDVIRAGLVKRLDKGDKGNGGDGTA